VVACIAKAQSALEKQAACVLAEYGLTTTQFEVLLNVWQSPGLIQQNLAFELVMTKGNICHTVDALVGGGYLERSQDPNDKRANRLNLTPRGLELLAEVLPRQKEALRQVLSSLSEKETDDLLALMHKLLGVARCNGLLITAQTSSA
jgi:DNA-binding MarR family transcriptional regulator